LIAIVVNRCRTYRAKNLTRRMLLERFSIGAAERWPAPAQQFDPDELSPSLARALARLSAGLREAFLLKHVEELTYEEMASATGIRISALKMRVKRAGERLAQELESRE
jgi:RNA polymerase sigma-70 factor (ECF subfamily)